MTLCLNQEQSRRQNIGCFEKKPASTDTGNDRTEETRPIDYALSFYAHQKLALLANLVSRQLLCTLSTLRAGPQTNQESGGDDSHIDAARSFRLLMTKRNSNFRSTLLEDRERLWERTLADEIRRLHPVLFSRCFPLLFRRSDQILFIAICKKWRPARRNPNPKDYQVHSEPLYTIVCWTRLRHYAKNNNSFG